MTRPQPSHFRGKQDLLTEASLHTFEHAIPIEGFQSLPSVADLIAVIAAELAEPGAMDPMLSRLMLETMREAEPDPTLRERLSTLIDAYRRLMVETVRADQQRGAVFAGASPQALATLLAAVGDRLEAARPAGPRARRRRRAGGPSSDDPQRSAAPLMSTLLQAPCRRALRRRRRS